MEHLHTFEKDGFDIEICQECTEFEISVFVIASQDGEELGEDDMTVYLNEEPTIDNILEKYDMVNSAIRKAKKVLKETA